MPIEIKELHIRVVVNASQAGQRADSPGQANNEAGEGNKDAVVAECVEQVLQILQCKAER